LQLLTTKFVPKLVQNVQVGIAHFYSFDASSKLFSSNNSSSTCLLVKPYRNPSLGLMTKAKACKGASQKEAWESHFMLPGM